MIRVTVDSRIRICDELPPDVERQLRDAFTHLNPQWLKLKRMGFPAWKEPRELITWKKDEQGISFPRGGMSRVRKILKDSGLAYQVKDARALGERAAGEYEIPDYRRPLWPHQQRAVDALALKENCLLRAPTGSGKTSVALALIAHMKVPTIIVVWTGSLFDQWMQRVADPKELGLRAHEIGVIRGTKRSIRPVTIAMQQTLAKGIDEELRQSFGCLILDEVQRSPAATVFNSIDPFPARYRFGISANETRKDRKECLVYDLFGQIACEISSDEVEAAGHTLDVEVRIRPSEFEAPWWLGVESSDFDAEVREPGKEKDFNRLLQEMADDEERESLIERVAIEHAKAGRQVIVFTRRREHAMQIDARVSSHGVVSGLLLGGQGEDERVRRATTDGIRAGKIQVGVGTIEAVGTGTDLPSVEVGIIALPLANNRQLFGQVRGRVCRSSKGKQSAVLEVIVDEKVFPHYRHNLIRWNRTVTEKKGDKWIPAERR